MPLQSKEHMSNHCPFWGGTVVGTFLFWVASTPRTSLWPLGFLEWLRGPGWSWRKPGIHSTEQVSSAELGHSDGDMSWAGSTGKQVFGKDWVKICQFIFPIFRVSELVQSPKVSQRSFLILFWNSLEPTLAFHFEAKVGRALWQTCPGSYPEPPEAVLSPASRVWKGTQRACPYWHGSPSSLLFAVRLLHSSYSMLSWHSCSSFNHSCIEWGTSSILQLE